MRVDLDFDVDKPLREYEIKALETAIAAGLEFGGYVIPVGAQTGGKGATRRLIVTFGANGLDEVSERRVLDIAEFVGRLIGVTNPRVTFVGLRSEKARA
jgi:hypothetical protein